MKVVVTYEREDILKLIEKDLTNSGLRHDMATAKYKGTARITIEVEGTPGMDPVETPIEAASPAEPKIEQPIERPREAPPPRLERVPDPPQEEPVGDMSAILRESNKNASSKPGMYPAPPRPLMEGESVEWPGAPEPRGR